MARSTVAVRFTGDISSLKRAAGQVESRLGNLGSKVAGAFGTAIKAGGALTAVVGGLAIKGGFERAMNIEDAQAALRGLGHDAKSIESIMDSALSSVKGTAFGLGDAATIASTAVAAGIEPGEKLTRVLTLTANSAALARTGLSEMGSILNKVWTAGRVGTEELNQLADRGIPIWTELAEHYQVSATELRKMVSDGKVDAETFAFVLENTVGDAAAEMGNTTRGAWANMLAALSRAGESFLKGIFPLFKEGLGGITSLFDNMAPVAERAGQMLAEVLAVVRAWWDKHGPAIVAAAREVFGELAAGVKEVIPSIQQFVKGALKSLGDWWSKNGPTIITAVKQIFAAVREAWPRISKIVQDAVLTIGTVVKAVVDLVLALWRKFGDNILRWVQAVWPHVASVIEGALQVIRGIVETVTALIQGDWSKVWDGIKQIVSGAWTAIKGVVGTALETLKGILGVAFEAIGTLASRAWDELKSGASNAVEGVLGFFRDLPQKLRDLLGSIGSAAKDIGSSIINKIGEGIGNITGFIGDVASSLWSGIKGYLNRNVFDKIRNYTVKIDPPGPGVLYEGKPFGSFPRLHTGGMFTAPPGQSEGLALLKDGEGVFTPDQIKALGAGLGRGSGGQTVVININGGTFLGTNQTQLKRELVAIMNQASGQGVR